MSGHVVYLRTRVSPRLVVTVPIEGEPVAAIVASTLEDQQRLALWLARSDVLDRLPSVAAGVVDDALDEERGAA